MTDAYEREHMPGVGEVLHRSKVVLPKWVYGVSAGLPLTATAITSAALLIGGTAPVLAALAPVLGGALLAAITSGLLVVYAAGRICVSEGELHVQLGPSGPRIPMDDIESFDIGPSGTARKGLGYRKHLDGTSIYNMMGASQRAVRIVRRSDPRRIVLVPRDPEALVAALREAKARAAGKVRVDLGASEAEELPAERAERERRRGR